MDLSKEGEETKGGKEPINDDVVSVINERRD